MMEGTAFEEVIEGARDLITVKRVYGDPYEKNGLTVIPAAAVRGGGGGGGGKQGDGASGSGGGFGVMARPSGAWIIEDGEVTWKPAVDVNKVVLGGQIVALVAILVAGRILRTQSRRQRWAPQIPRALRYARERRFDRSRLPAWVR
jgi:uncharacterized spore protein YtfJ